MFDAARVGGAGDLLRHYTPCPGRAQRHGGIYREHTVEIALGPKGALENGNIGTLARRVTQIMGMLRLAPEIEQHILSMPETIRRPAITERAPRSITMFDDKHHQLQALAHISSK